MPLKSNTRHGSLCGMNRYALDVNVERVEDVLLHKKLLEQAHEPMNGLVFDVRPSQVINSCASYIYFIYSY